LAVSSSSSSIRTRTAGLVLGQRQRRGEGLARRAGGYFYVPSDSFGGLSPERRAAVAMKNLFTMCAVRIVLAQLEGASAGRGSTAFGSYNPDACKTLYDHLEACEMRDGDEWVSQLMEKDRMLAMRILEVRNAYPSEGFEWDNLKKVSLELVEEANIKILRQGAEAILKGSSEP